jgi:surfactin synthase thioesterase subunit
MTLQAAAVADAWILEIRAGAGPRLVFFPPAGSSAPSGWALEPALPSGWSLLSVQYPARGSRLREPAAGSVNELSETCLPALDGGGAVLFGHSFGAYVAYDVAQLLEQRGTPAAGLIVSGMPAPGSVLRTMTDQELDDEALVASLARQQVTAPELLANEELMDLVLPVLRADLALARGYRDGHGRRLARTPVLAIAGQDDRLVTLDQLTAWRTVTDRWLGHELPPGEHFFYQQDPAGLARAVERHWPLGGVAQ